MVKKIYFDAGHGKHTAGKRSPSGIFKEREWFFNNEVALGFENRMKQYDKVELFRTDDRTGEKDILLRDRTDSAIKGKADIYISFHHNAFQSKWGTHTGVETFTYLGSQPEAEKLARLVQNSIVKSYGLRDRGLKKEDLHITRETSKKKIPSILIEGGFMDSSIDIVKLRDNSLLRKAGEGVADAVATYLKLKLKDKVTGGYATAKPTNSNPKVNPVTLYRVRKSWTDIKSQLGAYSNLINAKALADKNKGYKVFNESGKVVYEPKIVKPTVTKPVTNKVNNPVLKLGNKGEDVKKLQRLLNEKGNYGLSVDGDFGGLTDKAVRDFQRNQKISVDGSVGSITWSKLNSAPVYKAKLKEYVSLPAKAKSWGTYALNVQPVAKNISGYLNPSKYGGLTYEILGKPYSHVVTIKTSAGKRNIYIHPSTGAKVIKK